LTGALPRDLPSSVKSFFEPRSIAVAGVSSDPDKMGSIIFANLLENRKKGVLRAPVYALNPARDRIGDQPCYPSVGKLPEAPELLIIAVPESQTLGLVRDAAEAGVKAAVVITSGYAEVGKEGVEKEIGRVAGEHGMRILGPNTIGLLDTRSGVDSLFLRPTKRLPDGSEVPSLLRPLAGGVTVITQSGHLGEVISEQLAADGVGIRALVGTGNQLDVSVEEVVEYFADDPDTEVLAVYLEGLRDGRKFMQAATRAAERKPLVVIKVGKTEVGRRAALTHTASMVGSYEVYKAAFRQSGVVEADELQDLVDYAVSLSMLQRPAGRRLAIVTNAGGVGVIAADKAESLGLDVRPLRAGEQNRLRSKLGDPGLASNAALGNPIDLTASASTDEFVRATRSVLAMRGYDLALVLPTHQTPAIGYDIATKLAEAVAGEKKPAAMCVIGNSEFAESMQREFMARGIPSYPTPERATRALAAAWKYADLRRQARYPELTETSALLHGRVKSGPLPHKEVSRILRAYHIDEPRSVVVRSVGDLRRVQKVSFPVACKLLSRDMVHKKDAGGVVLGVESAEEAASVLARFRTLCARRGLRFEGMLAQEMVDGIELIVGGTRDPTFGPTVVFGLGGTYAELVRDYSLAIAPVTPREAERMIEGTKLGRVLGGYRGGPRVDLGPLSRLVSRFSGIVAENHLIEQAEVNPLIVGGRRMVAVDARVIVSSH